jgi:hypothetical protein
MSWSVQKTIGEPARVRAVVEPAFDNAAKYYEKTSPAEFADIIAAKERVLAWLDRVPDGQAAIVEANGSRGDGWMSLTITCSTVKLA